MIGYRNVLVAVAVSPDSYPLVEKAIALVKPYSGNITLITLLEENDLCSSFSGCMLGDIRELLQEETTLFLSSIEQKFAYPNMSHVTAHGNLSDSIIAACKEREIDLLICGHHNGSLINKILSSSNRIIDMAHVDVLIIQL